MVSIFRTTDRDDHVKYPSTDGLHVAGLQDQHAEINSRCNCRPQQDHNIFFVPSSLGVSFFEFPWRNLSESHFGPLHFLTLEDGEDDASKTESVLQEGWITVDFAKFWVSIFGGGPPWAPEFMAIFSATFECRTWGNHFQTNIWQNPIAPGLFKDFEAKSHFFG